MYMERIELACADERTPPRPRGRRLLGVAFLVVAIPYWTAWLLLGALWRDVRGLGRLVHMCGDACAEASERR